MPVSLITNNSNPTASTSSTLNNNNKTPLTFSAADFQRWNQTTSVIHIPAKLVGKDKIPKVRGDIVKAIGEKKVAAVQALSATKYRIAFTSSSYRHERDVNGIHFRGVTLTPHPAYEEVKSVFVDRAPLQMPDQYLYDLLAPYGRVLSIEHLKVKGFQNVKSGTRRVSMVINKSIPAVIKISNIQLSFRYRGQPPFCFVCQEVGHAGKDCPKSRQSRRNIINNADLSPEDLRHKLNNVKEGDLRVKLHSKKVGQVPKSGPAATSSSCPPSLTTADSPKPTSHQGTSSSPTGETTKNVPQGDQPIDSKPSSSSSLTAVISELKKVFRIPAAMDGKATSVAASSAVAEKSTASIGKSASSSSSTSEPSEVLSATLSTLKTGVEEPSEMDSIAESGAVASFESLAKKTQSAAAQSTAASISATEAVDSGFIVAINGQVVKSTPSIPQTKSFGFCLKPARSSTYSSVPPASTWSASYPSATGTRVFGGKGRDTSETDEDYDLPLLKRFCKRKEAKLVVSSPAAMEEDSVEECLHGTSVVDPLVSEETGDRANVAPDPVTEAVSTQDAPDMTHLQEAITDPLPAAVSSPERAEHEPPEDASTPASFLSSGPIDALSLESSPDLFTLLTAAAPVIADSTESASRSASVPPDVELFSDPAGQDRVRELMLELPILDLE